MMDNFWAGFGWVIGGMFAMVGFSIVMLMALFWISRWIDNDK